jgi:alpha-ketoglutarate-dependent taurine dioxygenase
MTAQLMTGRPMHRQARPAAGGDALGWLAENRLKLRADLVHCGAVLVRGIDVDGPDRLRAAARALGVRLVPEREQFARRAELGDGVYGPSDWPVDEAMCPHHEQSQRLEVPGVMLFGCVRAGGDGGTMLVADSAHVVQRLPADLVERFERVGWYLLRSYRNDFVGVPWQEAFGTADRAAVRAYCAEQGIAFSVTGGGLRTAQWRPSIVAHPVTGERCWFNAVAFLNGHSLDATVREVLLHAYGPGGLPFDTAFGDGEPIGADVVGTINDAYERTAVPVPWQDGDLLLVDNIRMAHGRQPYRGDRELVVALGDPVRPSGARIGPLEEASKLL